MADVNISTTYDPGRALVQKMPGAEPAGNLTDGLLALFRARKAAAGAAPAGPAASQPQRGYTEAPRRLSTSQPTMGTQQTSPAYQAREEVLTRTVPDPFASPYTKMATGFDPGSRVEKGYRQKDGSIQWEFADLRPSGGSGGFQGGGAASTLHASANLGGAGPVDAILANRDDYEPLTGMRRFKPGDAAGQKGGKG